MAQFILKDSKGKEQTFDHETIYVRDTNGELVQFTQGEGDIPAVVQPLEVTENGTYTAPDGVDGYSPVTVNVDPTKITVLREQEMTGFALDAEFGYAKGDTEPTFTLTEGEKYFVTWDGVTYETTALPADSFADGAVYVGNGSPMGLTGNGEPFAIAYMNGMIFYLAFTDASESHTVGIYQSAIKEIVLQDKTITENGEYTADEGFDGLGKVLVEIASGGGTLVAKTGTFTGNGSTVTVTHNLGVIPLAFWCRVNGGLGATSSTAGGTLEMAYGFSSEVGSVFGGNTGLIGGLAWNSYTKNMYSTTGYKVIDETGGIVSDATTTTVKACNSGYPSASGKNYTWYAFGLKTS